MESFLSHFALFTSDAQFIFDLMQVETSPQKDPQLFRDSPNKNRFWEVRAF
jgi:hypothetical protein